MYLKIKLQTSGGNILFFLFLSIWYNTDRQWTCIFNQYKLNTAIMEKISKYQMPNDQMPNYGVHTQYVSIRSTSQKCNQIIKKRRERERENKEKTIRDKRREEKR